jgi:hypothetical protein
MVTSMPTSGQPACNVDQHIQQEEDACKRHTIFQTPHFQTHQGTRAKERARHWNLFSGSVHDTSQLTAQL